MTHHGFARIAPSAPRIAPFIANRPLPHPCLRYRHFIPETRRIGLPPRAPHTIGKNMSMIRIVFCATALLACTGAASAHAPGDARQSAPTSIEVKEGDGPERVVARQRPAQRNPYLLSTNRWSEMMLKDDTVYLQLTDYGMKQIGETQDGDKKDEGFLGNIVKAMALSGVKQLLDHSLALSLTDLRTARVRGGEFVLVTCKGREVFNNVKINGQVQKFEPDQAEDFAKSVNRQRAKLAACPA